MASMFLTCAVGSAAADIKARMHRPALDKTDVPGRISLMPGGVSRNIAENLARLGARSVFVGVFGDDAQAHSVIEASQAAGVHVGPILRPGYPTASMAVTLDVAGRQVAGVFSGEILDTLTPGDLLPHRDVIGQADAIVSDGGAPEDILIYLAESARQEAVFYCNPASVAFSARLTPVLARCDLLTCNHLEAYALTGSSAESEAEALRAASTLVERGVKRAVITLGPRGLVYADAGRGEHRPALPARVVDATGAGDALAAAMIIALLHGDSIDTALKLGLAAAALTCEAETSVSPAMSFNAIHNTW